MFISIVCAYTVYKHLFSKLLSKICYDRYKYKHYDIEECDKGKLQAFIILPKDLHTIQDEDKRKITKLLKDEEIFQKERFSLLAISRRTKDDYSRKD